MPESEHATKCATVAKNCPASPPEDLGTLGTLGTAIPSVPTEGLGDRPPKERPTQPTVAESTGGRHPARSEATARPLRRTAQRPYRRPSSSPVRRGPPQRQSPCGLPR